MLNSAKIPPISNLVKSQQLSFIASYNQRASLLAQEGVDVIKLSGGDPSHYPSELLSLLSELNHELDESIFSYSPIMGFGHLRELLASVVSHRYHELFKKNNILISSGACSCLFLTLKTILNVGDKVLMQNPSWEYLPKLIENCGGIPVKMSFFFKPWINHQWDELIAEIKSHIELGIRAVVINSPLNPSGVIIPVEVKNAIIDLCEEADVWFLSDDVTADFNYLDENSDIKLHNKSCFVSINSFSKNLGVTGFRFGFVAANDALIEEMKKSQLYTCMYPNSLIQKIIERYLSYGLDRYYEFINKITSFYKVRIKEYASIFSGLDELEVFKPEGGLFVFPKIKSGYRLDFDELLDRHHIAVAPGEAFSAECGDYFRVFVGTNKHVATEACQAIKKLF